MTDYSKQQWSDGEGGGTPVTAYRLNRMEQGIDSAHEEIHEHLTAVEGAHDATAIAVDGAGTLAATDVHEALAELDADKADVGHSHAHPNATQVTFIPTGTVAASTVQGAIAELENEKAPAGHLHVKQK